MKKNESETVLTHFHDRNATEIFIYNLSVVTIQFDMLKTQDVFWSSRKQKFIHRK